MLPRTIVTVILIVFVAELAANPHSQTKDNFKDEKKRCTNPTKRRAWQVPTTPHPRSSASRPTGPLNSAKLNNKPSASGLTFRPTHMHQANGRLRHTLSDGQKRSYIDAQRCVMEKPGSLGLPAAKTAYDEMAANHQILGRTIHATGSFLPYHRYLLHAHEVLLRECGFEDGVPYWDEYRDAGKFSESEIFNTETGFGTGEKDMRCVTDGPFANVTCPIGPGWRLNETCLTRNVNDMISLWASKEKVDDCTGYEDFANFAPCLYMMPHRGGHGGVGGTMRDPLGSPGEPLFYLHHAWVDKLWWDWQEADPKSRTHDIAGPNTQGFEVGFPEVPGNIDEEDEAVFGEMIEEQRRWEDSGTRGDEGGEVTLSHVLTSLGVIPDVEVGEVMDTRGKYLCYEYV